MESQIIKIVTEFGSVGISVFTLFILYKIVGNHINSSTKAITELCSLVREVKAILQKDINKPK